MPDSIATQHAPTNYAIGSKHQDFLAFNNSKKIACIRLDTLDFPQFSPSKTLSINTLTLCNLVYSLSIPLGIVPGESHEKDKKILAHIKNRLGDNVANPKNVIQQMIEAWHEMAAHPLARHVRFRSMDSTFGASGPYGFFLGHYASRILLPLINNPLKLPPTRTLQAVELLISTLRAMPYNNDRRAQRQHFSEFTKQWIPTLPGSSKVKSRLHAISESLVSPQQGLTPGFNARRLTSASAPNLRSLAPDSPTSPTSPLGTKLRHKSAHF